MKVFKSIICIYIFLILNCHALEGHETGNGGDNFRPENNSAWFLGDKNKKITFCINRLQDFPIDKEELVYLISAAFRSWGNYIDQKTSRLEYKSNFGRVMEIVTNLQYQESCNKQVDLTFYFGTDSPVINKIKQNFYNPSAFAHRESYDMHKGWGKGFIWFSKPHIVIPEISFPDWNNYKKLFAMLLHETGHVLGCGHIENTIMTKNISLLLRKNSREEFLTKIDHFKELVSQSSYNLPKMGIGKEGFSYLLGYMPSEFKHSKLSLKWSYPVTNAELILIDGDSQAKFNLKLGQTITPNSCLNSGPPIFKKVWYTDDKSDLKMHPVISQYNFKQRVAVGTITSQFDGKSYPVVLENNMGDSNFLLSLINLNGKKIYLYEK